MSVVIGREITRIVETSLWDMRRVYIISPWVRKVSSPNISSKMKEEA